MNLIKDVQGIELMAGDKVAFFEVPRTKRLGLPFMAIGVIKKIHDHDDPLRNITITRNDNRLRYRKPCNLALIPDENEEEEGGGGGEPDENPKESQQGGEEGQPQEGGPEATPKAGDSPTKEETDSGDGNPQKGGDSESKGKTKKPTKDRLGETQKGKLEQQRKRLEKAAFDKMMRDEGGNPSETRGDGGRLHFGVEYDFKTGETRKTKCECPQCRGVD